MNINNLGGKMATVKKLNETTYEVQVTKSGEEFKHFKEHIFKHFKDAKVDGFRPGKVPTSVIENTFKNEIRYHSFRKWSWWLCNCY